MHDQLDNDALLVLYLSGELSSDQRASLERQLESDPALREMLAQLKDDQESAEAALARADEVDPLSATLAAAVVRRTGRALRQAQAERAARRPAIQPARRLLPFGWRSYSGAAIAAGLFVALLIWWGNQKPPPVPEVADNTEYTTDDPNLDVDLATRDVPDDPEDERLALTYGASLNIGPAEQDPGTLATVEDDLRDLRRVGRSDGLMMGL